MPAKLGQILLQVETNFRSISGWLGKHKVTGSILVVGTVLVAATIFVSMVFTFGMTAAICGAVGGGAIFAGWVVLGSYGIKHHPRSKKDQPPPAPPAPEIASHDKETCAICLAEKDKSDLFALPCKHLFDQQCITKWFNKQVSDKTSPTCPICRKPVSAESLEKLKINIPPVSGEKI
jgi:hypothetical protein